MNIAMIGHKRVPGREGGVEVVVEELAGQLTAMGHTVTLYNRAAKGAPKCSEYAGARIVTVPTVNKKSLDAVIYSFLATLHALFGGYDVIHYHALGPSVMLALPHFLGKRTVATVHGLDWQRAKWGGFATRFLRFGERMAAKYADEIIVLSASMQQYFADTYHRQTVRIENGIDPPETADLSLLSRFGLEKDGYILFLGRIVPEKGIHYLIDAYRTLQTDKKLVIAGGASHSEEYFNQLKAKAAGDARIVFTDFVQGAPLAALYAGAYLYCLPSDLEGMPISLLEAMSYGNCCVTSDIPECTEVCGDHGFAFQKGNTADLKRLLEQLLSQPDMVKRCKATAADYILQKYNWGQVTERTLELYEQVKSAK